MPMKTSLLSFASLCLLAWSAGAANPITNGGFEELTPMGLAPGWELLGNAAVRTEHVAAGQRALCLQRKPNADGETGLNRAWELRSGRQGGMLAECKGAIRFRYFAVAQEEPGALTIQIIPMTEKCLEYGGKRTVWRVPSNQVGDGKWHQGEFAYDYSQAKEVRWVHVGARLLAPGELWLDEFEWVPEVDAVPQITKLDFAEQPGQEGRDGWLHATIVNMGSKPLAAGTTSLDLPVGLTGADAVVGKKALGRIRGQDGIANIGVAGPYFFNRQIVGNHIFSSFGQLTYIINADQKFIITDLFKSCAPPNSFTRLAKIAFFTRLCFLNGFLIIIV